MDQQSSLNSEQRSSLVAYLDGELDEAAVRDVERLLADNPSARREIEMLSRTFEMLEELPHTSTSAEFTTRTLSAINVDKSAAAPQMASQELTSRNDWYQSLRKWAVLVGTVCLLSTAALIGFLGTNRWIPDESQMLIRDLPIVESIDKYSEIEDIAFLRALHQSEMFNENDRLPEQ